MIVQWFLCTLCTHVNGEAVTVIRPNGIVDTKIVDGVELPKHAYKQWSAAYYPLGVPQQQYEHAVVRTESEASIAMHDGIDVIELVTIEDWDMVRGMHPELRKHWSDQPGVA